MSHEIGSYTFTKTLEYKAKQNLKPGKEVVVVPPNEYQVRFANTMDGYFLACPGRPKITSRSWTEVLTNFIQTNSRELQMTNATTAIPKCFEVYFKTDDVVGGWTTYRTLMLHISRHSVIPSAHCDIPKRVTFGLECMHYK